MGAQAKQGETFMTDTDTEVIPKLCKWIYHHLSSPMPFSEVGNYLNPNATRSTFNNL